MKHVISMQKLALALLAASLLVAPNTYADDWKFGLGTGLRSLALDGDVGFAGENGGVVADIDLDNGDTADMFESAFGFAGFAQKGDWKINFGYATLTLEDDDSNLDAEWDKAQGHLEVEYHFATTGNHRWGALAGVTMFDHEWEFKNKATGFKSKPEDDWTDAVVGLTHSVPLSNKWVWSNRADYMFGDSEGGFGISTSINWLVAESWVVNFGISYEDLEYGDEGDINDNDFYYYDVEETTIGAGFMYTW